MPNTDAAWDASRLRALVDASGLRHKWIAEKLGVDPTTFSRWYRGKTMPSLKDGVALARLLSVSPDDLVA